MTPSLESLLQPVIDLAKEASARVLEVYESADFSVEAKQDDSPLTAADLASHKAICAGLKRLTPGIPILSEESAKIPYSERSSWSEYWLVDPLDGTKEFIKRNGEFTVNIALVRGDKVVMGVVDVPVSGTTFYAAEGIGAFKRETGTDASRALTTKSLNPELIRVSGSRSHGNSLMEDFTKTLPGKVELIARGSSLKLCMVADGEADIYPRFGLTSEWDTAAAQCVVEQAGGIVVDLDFNPVVYNSKDSLLNPFFLVIADPTFDWKSCIPADAKKQS